jgi:hypothetical protein
MPESSEELQSAPIAGQPPAVAKPKWHAEDGHLGKLAQRAWRILYKWPFTAFGILLAVVACTRPQVFHVVADVPWSYELRQGLLWALLYGLGVLVLVAATVIGMVLVIPSDRELETTDLSQMRWHRRAGEWTKRRFAELLSYLANRYNALDLWLFARETGGAAPDAPLLAPPRRSRSRWAVGLSFLLVGLAVWLGGIAEARESPWSGGSRRLLLALGLALSGLWFLFGYERPTAPRRRALGRYALMTLIALIAGETLWALPSHFQGLFSYRYYTIWGVLFLLFIIVATGRLIDRTALRARFALVLIVLALARWSSGFQVDTRAVSGTRAVERALLDEGEEWFVRLERRIAAGDPARPVVFVAASGGGSRAAIFASLVYEYLNNMGFDGAAAPSPDAAMARNVAAMSGVSGGSLATAYYLVHPRPDRRDVPRNYTAGEVADGMVETANGYVKQTRSCHDDPRTCLWPEEDELVRHRRSDACVDVAAQMGRLPARGPDAAPWLFRSAFVDDMATDFMAPLLRGVLTPFLERGHSVSDFWAEHFEWVGTTQRSCLTAPTKEGRWVCDWSRATPPPLAMLNATDVANGRRVVIGYPPVPVGLLGAGMASLSDSGGAHELSLADGARLSANFPWGFEIGMFATQSYTRLLPSSLKLTDGGVTDNSGLDTIATMLERLEVLARPPDTNALPQTNSREDYYTTHARAVRDALVRRGVMLIEIDSGARPARAEALGYVLPAVADPLDAMSLAGFGGTTTIKTGHISRLRDALDHMARQVPEHERLGSGQLFYHLPFVCNHADAVMTAWALGPKDKAKLMTMFLVEAQANAVALKARAESLVALNREIESASKTAAAPRNAAEGRMAAKLIEDARQGEEARLRDDSDTFGPQQVVAVPVAEHRDDPPPPPNAPAAAPPRPSPPPPSPTPVKQEGWIYLGQYDEGAGRWVSNRLGKSKKEPPPDPDHALDEGASLTALGRVSIRQDKPDANATFSPVKALLQPGSTVKLAGKPERWQGTGFVWARVTY